MLKEHWTYKKLGEVCTFITKGTTPTSLGFEFTEDGVAFIKIESLTDEGGVSPSMVAHISEECNNALKRSQLEEFDILYSIAGALGRVAVVPKSILPANTNQALAIIRLIDKNPTFIHFLKHFLQSKKMLETVMGLKVGVAQQNLSLAQIRELSIPIPTYDEQSCIVSELDLLQSIIDKQQAQLKELDKLAQAVFYDMFGDPVENEKGWEVKKLGELCSKIGSGATPRGGNESYKTEGISLIRSLNVHNNEFVYKDLAFIDEEQAQALSNVEVQSDDILLNITGASVARCCIVPNHLLPARVNQHVCIIRPSKNIEVRYLSRLITNIQYQSFLIDLARGKAATREALPKSIVENLPIILPPLSLQQSFAAKIESIEKQKAAISQSIVETQKLFDYTMDKYFG